MIIKMVNEFKLTISSMLHTQTRCRSVHVRDLPLDKKLENQDWAAGHGPLGLLLAKPGAVHYR